MALFLTSWGQNALGLKQMGPNHQWHRPPGDNGDERALYTQWREYTPHHKRSSIFQQSHVGYKNYYYYSKGMTRVSSVKAKSSKSKSSSSRDHGHWTLKGKGKGNVYWKGAKGRWKGKGGDIADDVFDSEDPPPTPFLTRSPTTSTASPTSFPTPNDNTQSPRSSPDSTSSPSALPGPVSSEAPTPIRTTSQPSSRPTTQSPTTSSPTSVPVAQPTRVPATTFSPTFPATLSPTTLETDGTFAPTPTDQGNGIFRIPSTGFNITYFTTNSNFVSQEEFDDLVAISLAYLGDYMRNILQNQDEWDYVGQSTRVRGTFFQFQSGTPLLHNFAGLFRDIKPLPTTEDLDRLIEPAFTQPEAVEIYIALIRTLPPENPFSETFEIEYVLVGGSDDAPDIPRQQSTPFELAIHGNSAEERGSFNKGTIVRTVLFSVGVAYTLVLLWQFRRWTAGLGR